jgi:hypothetical protein
MTSSNSVDWMTGKSAGLVPLSIWPGVDAHLVKGIVDVGSVAHLIAMLIRHEKKPVLSPEPALFIRSDYQVTLSGSISFTPSLGVG